MCAFIERIFGQFFTTRFTFPSFPVSLLSSTYDTASNGCDGKSTAEKYSPSSPRDEVYA